MRHPLSIFKPEWFHVEPDSDAHRWLEEIRANSIDIRQEDVTFNPAAVAANITVEQTVTLTGLKTVDTILKVEKPTLDAGLAVTSGRVSAGDTLAITYINTTAGAINPGSEVYKVTYIKNSRN